MKALKWSFFKWLISSLAFPLYQISGSFQAEAQTTFSEKSFISFLSQVSTSAPGFVQPLEFTYPIPSRWLWIPYKDMEKEVKDVNY